MKFDGTVSSGLGKLALIIRGAMVFSLLWFPMLFSTNLVKLNANVFLKVEYVAHTRRKSESKTKKSSEEHFIRELNARISDVDSAKSLQNIRRKCEAYLYCFCFK